MPEQRAATPADIFGENVFNEAVMRERLSEATFKTLKRTISSGAELDSSVADEVASSMKAWAIEKGATHYTHWFQPMNGVTAEKHDAFISPKGDGTVILSFSGKDLIKGEPDASSFPSGGLRETAAARGYTAWDCTSPAFVKEGTLYIPTAFFSYTGEILDKKAPLLRSVQALNRQGLRVLRALGNGTSKQITATIGPEQEYFLISSELYEKRLDLKLTGRTLFGAPSPKGQELDDQYFGALRIKVTDFMHDLDRTLWKLGITAKTKHNEVAPAQHELAIIYDPASVGADHNLLVMEMMKKVAKKHGLACLLHEKPFDGLNGSGKHLNWSMATDDGINLLDPGLKPSENIRFLVFLAAVVKAVDKYADLLRLSVATASNDHRLGANEAPPGIISMFVGEELDAIIDSIVSGKAYDPKGRIKTDLGVASLPEITEDTTDRNRTSPFAFTGSRFEFRMCGSSTNIAEPCFTLNTIVAQALSEIADTLEKADSVEVAAARVVKEFLTEHRRIIFNGNNYAPGWVDEAKKRGLPDIKNTVEAAKALKDAKNIEVFTNQKVLSETEVDSRYNILIDKYAKTVNIEAKTFVDIVNRQLLPAGLEYAGRLADIAEKTGSVIAAERQTAVVRLTDKAGAAVDRLEAETRGAASDDALKTAENYCHKVLPAMGELRKVIDELEPLVPADIWPVPVYSDLLFRV